MTYRELGFRVRAHNRFDIICNYRPWIGLSPVGKTTTRRRTRHAQRVEYRGEEAGAGEEADTGSTAR